MNRRLDETRIWLVSLVGAAGLLVIGVNELLRRADKAACSFANTTHLPHPKEP